jgi:uncharacterized protein
VTGLVQETRASVALERAYRFTAALPVAQCPRLAGEVVDADTTSLQVDLQADRGSGWPRLHGSIEGSVTLACQRCGKSFAYALRLAPDLRLVFSEAEERSALADAEPLLIEDDRLRLRQIVEEEVLLALPMLARCESCENEVNRMPASSTQASEQEAPAPRDNPFAALKRQLQSNRE